MSIKLSKSKDGVHKMTAEFPDGSRVHFGRRGYSDYTMHRDKERMKRYLVRHRKRENWRRSGDKSAGFWSRWVLWSEPSLQAAIKRTQQVLGKKIVYKYK
jgi:hypothetical protein